MLAVFSTCWLILSFICFDGLGAKEIQVSLLTSLSEDTANVETSDSVRVLRNEGLRNKAKSFFPLCLFVFP